MLKWNTLYRGPPQNLKNLRIERYPFLFDYDSTGLVNRMRFVMHIAFDTLQGIQGEVRIIGRVLCLNIII